MSMSTSGGWIEGHAYDLSGALVANAPVVVRNSSNTIVGIYFTEDNGASEGYSSSDTGYYKVAAPAGSDYSVEVWDDSNNRIGLATTGVNVTVGATTSNVDINKLETDLAINKTGPGFSTPGDTITYTISLSNTGLLTATSTVVTDTLPSQVTFVTYTTSLAVTFTQPSANTLVWELGDVLSQTTGLSITVQGTVSSSVSVPSVITNTVEASTTATETVTANNTAQWVTQIGAPDLQVLKTGPATVNAGDTLTFTITYSNSGPLDATGVTLVDQLPAAMTYITDSAGGVHSGGVITWNVGDLNVSASGTVVVTATATYAGVYTNQVSISADQVDVYPADNHSSWPVTINGADPYVLKAGPGALLGGEVFSYTIVYGNDGNQPADVTITDTLPVSFTVADIAYDTSGLNVIVDSGTTRAWTATVAAGDRLTFTLALTAPTSIASGTRVTNTVEIATALAGDDPTDNIAAASSRVYQIVSIATARASSIGTLVAVEGTVTAEPGVFKESSGAANRKLYFQDSTGGLLVYRAGGLDVVDRSHKVRVIGTIDVYRTETELVPANVTDVIDMGADTPVSAVITNTGAVSESLEGQLVQVEGFVVGKPAAYRLQVDDGTGVVEIYRYYNLGQITDPNYIDFDQFQIGDYVRATGPTRGYDYSGVVRREILPRSPADMWRQPTGFRISKIAPGSVLTNTVFTYTLVARNDIGVPATNVLITDSLPLSVSISVVSDGGEVLTGNVVSWTIASLAQNASVTRTVMVTAPGNVATLVNSDYGVSATEYVTRVTGLPVTTLVVLRDCSICRVQGSGGASPYNGQVVSVTGVIYDLIQTNGPTSTRYGFFMQAKSGTEDGHPATSDGLYVFLNTATTIGGYAPAVGDEIVITGTVAETNGLTQIANPTGAAKLGDVDVETAVPPTELVPLDEVNADNAYRETLESMRVMVPAGAPVVAPTYRFVSTDDTEFYVIHPNHPVAQRSDPFARRVWRDGEALDHGTSTDGNSYRISVEANVLKGNANDYGIQMPRANVYDVVTNTLVGPLTFAYSRYTLMVEDTPAISPTVDASTNSPPQAPDRARQFSMATMNVENLYDYTDDPDDSCDYADDPGCPGVNPPFNYVPADEDAYRAHIAKVAQEVIAAQSPDIIAIQEAEDQDVCTGGGEIHGTCSITPTTHPDGQLDVLQDLAREIYVRSGNVISYQTAADRAGADYRGIIVGYLFRADRVELVPTTTLSADPVLGTRPTDPYSNTYPHNIEVLNPKAMQALASTAAQADGLGAALFERLPQVALFRVHRTSVADSEFVEVYAIGNHFKSSPDSYVQRRTEQASYNAQLVSDVLTTTPGARVAVLGDLNVYPDSAQLASLYVQMSNLHYEIPAASRYSYVYQGQTQTLDQIFVTSALSQTLAAARAAHVNADWSYDYDVISTTVHKASDHDPIVATFNLPPIPANLTGSSKTSSTSGAVLPGNLITYTIILSNSGDMNASVHVTDTLGSYYTVYNALDFSQPTTGTLTWTGVVTGGQSITLRFVVRVASLNQLSIGTTILNNSATVSDGVHAPFVLNAPNPPSVTIYGNFMPIVMRQ